MQFFFSLWFSDHHSLLFPFFPHTCSSYLWSSLLQYLQSLTPHFLITYSNRILHPANTWFISVTPPVKFHIIKSTLTYKSFLYFYPFFHNLTSLLLQWETLTFMPPRLWKIQVEIIKEDGRRRQEGNQALTTMETLSWMVKKVGFSGEIVWPQPGVHNMSVSLKFTVTRRSSVSATKSYKM